MSSRSKGHSSVRKLIILAVIVSVLLTVSQIIPRQSQTLRINTDTQGIGIQNIECSFSDEGIAYQNGTNINYRENYIEVVINGKGAGSTHLTVTVRSDKNKIVKKTEYDIKVNPLRMIESEEIQ